LEDPEEIVAMVSIGYKLTQPSACPSGIFQLMLACTKLDPEERPSFQDIQTQLVQCSNEFLTENYYVKDHE
jgi:hypothetical protein